MQHDQTFADLLHSLGRDEAGETAHGLEKAFLLELAVDRIHQLVGLDDSAGIELLGAVAPCVGRDEDLRLEGRRQAQA